MMYFLLYQIFTENAMHSNKFHLYLLRSSAERNIQYHHQRESDGKHQDTDIGMFTL